MEKILSECVIEFGTKKKNNPVIILKSLLERVKNQDSNWEQMYRWIRMTITNKTFWLKICACIVRVCAYH